MITPFIDIESSGLEPDKDLLLEVGVVVADLSSGEEIADFRFGLRYPGEVLDAVRDSCDPFVREMHDCSRLWLWLRNETDKVSPEGLDEALCHIAGIWLPDKPPLANFNAPFDRRWLALWAPRFVSTCLNHRCFDCSTLRETVAQVYPHGFGPQKQAEVHRAVPDARQALEYWRWYKAHVMSPYGRRV